MLLKLISIILHSFLYLDTGQHDQVCGTFYWTVFSRDHGNQLVLIAKLHLVRSAEERDRKSGQL